MLFRYLSNYYCYILLVLLFQVAGQGIIYVYQSCRRPADHVDVESSVVEDGTDGSDGSGGADALGDRPVSSKVV